MLQITYYTSDPIIFLHAGKFVSESKFQANPGAFIPHILQPNPEALDALITKPEVERKLLQRLRKKAATYAQEVIGEDAPSPCIDQQNAKLDVDGVVDFYENWLIPLTKKVEVILAMLPPKYLHSLTTILGRLPSL